MVRGAKSEPNQEMNLERTEAGLETRLRIAGISRFGGAAFLLVWLAGWAVGECFAC